MFLHLSLILFTGGVHSPGQTPPQADTPPPPADTPPGRRPPPGMTTAADGTHPTGMHSCLF